MARLKPKMALLTVICLIAIAQFVYFTLSQLRVSWISPDDLPDKILLAKLSGNSLTKTNGITKENNFIKNNDELSTSSFDYFKASFKISESPIKELVENQETFCGGKFVGFNGKMAKIDNLILDPKKAAGKAGGEKNLSAVLNQNEQLEYLSLQKGYFGVDCQQFEYQMSPSTYLPNWFNCIEFQGDYKAKAENAETIDGVTFALTRYEYAHLLFNVVDFYHVFLAMMVLRLDQTKINILWIDSHPESTLDSSWEVIFGKVYRAGALTKPILFKTMVWDMQGYSSPMHFKNELPCPYLTEFREFILKKLRVNQQRQLNCAKMTVMFVWRRNYVAHPRNPSGQVSRKVKNENELLQAVQKSLPGHHVFGVQLDKVSLKEQLEFAVNTDIMIGLHGAGFTHVAFMQNYAALVEMFPTYFGEDDSYSWLAKWRNVHYIRWKNSDQSLELPNMYTKLPEVKVVELVQQMKNKICPTT